MCVLVSIAICVCVLGTFFFYIFSWIMPTFIVTERERQEYKKKNNIYNTKKAVCWVRQHTVVQTYTHTCIHLHTWIMNGKENGKSLSALFLSFVVFVIPMWILLEFTSCAFAYYFCITKKSTTFLSRTFWKEWKTKRKRWSIDKEISLRIFFFRWNVKHWFLCENVCVLTFFESVDWNVMHSDEETKRMPFGT